MSFDCDLLLTDAFVATPNGRRELDVAVRHGSTAWFGAPGTCPLRPAVTLPQGGCTMLPGLVDPHVHFREPGAHSHKGTYATESRAAAAGGVTCVLTMPNTVPFTGTREVLERVRICARRATNVDYGLHFGVDAAQLDELTCVRNVPAFKLYMNETTGIDTPLCDESVLSRVFAVGHPVIVHAEADTLDYVLDVHRRHGLGLLYVAHVALAREVEAIRAAKAAGQLVYSEVTPHHLLLTEADFARLGAFADMRPTLKTKADTAALWAGLADGTIDCIGTDHAPHLKSEKEAEKWPPGITGLQTMLPLMLTAVSAGRLSLERLVTATSLYPATIFGLQQKGELRVGAEADFAVVDLDCEHVIRDEDELSNAGWTPFAGTSCRGQVVRTILRGQVIYEAGRMVVEGAGREVLTRDPGKWQSRG